MTPARLRWLLVILALALGAGAAIVHPPARVRASAPASIYKPPSGC
jgi:hypothetical protein